MRKIFPLKKRLKETLVCTVQDTMYVAVRYCSKLFSYGLPGAGVLMADCITACSAVLAYPGRPSDVSKEKGKERN